MEVTKQALEIRDRGDTLPANDNLVMAWAREVATGAPVYIFELDASRNGMRCGCECPNCAAPLTAVNAGKRLFRRRPHFRHPPGAQRTECALLTARAAALRTLLEDGRLQLPTRRVSARFTGLSGTVYEASRDHPGESVRLQHFDFVDRTRALLTLQDGRQIVVDLTGSTSGSNLPSIYIDISDPALAALAPSELREHLSLMPDVLCWSSHWADDQLRSAATTLAKEGAVDHIDWPTSDLELLDGLPAGYQRETLLHLEVKNIIASAGHLATPDWRPTTAQSGTGSMWYRGRVLTTKDARVEARIGRIVPDVVCTAWAESGPRFEPLMIEVTVTHGINSEKDARIRATGNACLEVDLAAAGGGCITRAQLRDEVVNGLSLKRWIYVPPTGLEQEFGAALAFAPSITHSPVRRVNDLRPSAVPYAMSALRPVALSLLEAARSLFAESVEPAPTRERMLRIKVDKLASRVAEYGYPEVLEEGFLAPWGMLHRLIAIHDVSSHAMRRNIVTVPSAGVLRDIRESPGGKDGNSDASIYLIAVKTYKPRMSPEEQMAWDLWADQVRAAVVAGDTRYFRDPRLDRLLSELFPEMAVSLSKAGGKKAQAIPAHAPVRPYLASEGESPWLKGRAYAEWKRSNPEAARAWEAQTKDRALK